MTIDPKTTAVLLIEYQNDFTTEGGALLSLSDRQFQAVILPAIEDTCATEPNTSQPGQGVVAALRSEGTLGLMRGWGPTHM
jgi:nicotinamidase-related amidase